MIDLRNCPWQQSDLLGTFHSARTRTEKHRFTDFCEIAGARTCNSRRRLSEEIMMQTYYFVALGALFSLVASMPARADTDLTGKWVGQLNGMQIEVPTERGRFGAP